MIFRGFDVDFRPYGKRQIGGVFGEADTEEGQREAYHRCERNYGDRRFANVGSFARVEVGVFFSVFFMI